MCTSKARLLCLCGCLMSLLTDSNKTAMTFPTCHVTIAAAWKVRHLPSLFSSVPLVLCATILPSSCIAHKAFSHHQVLHSSHVWRPGSRIEHVKRCNENSYIHGHPKNSVQRSLQNRYSPWQNKNTAQVLHLELQCTCHLCLCSPKHNSLVAPVDRLQWSIAECKRDGTTGSDAI